MDIQTYSKLALRTANVYPEREMNVMHAASGLSGEAGEVMDIAKKMFFYGREIDREHLAEEIADCLWYANLMIVSLGMTWEEVMERNIRKLEVRYPDLRFDAERANNRDTDAEAAAMRGAR